VVECYEIQQKWGLPSAVVAMAAMEHVFALDAKKRTLVNQAMQKVEELRNMFQRNEEAKGGGEPEQRLTTEMIFARIEKTQTQAEKHAMRAVEAYDMEYKVEQNPAKKTQLAGFLVKARKMLNDASDALLKGPGGYTEKDIKEAIVALTPNRALVEKMLESLGQAPTGASSTAAGKGTVDSKEAATQLAEIWKSLLKAVILQNSDRGQGEVTFQVTHNTKESKQHLRSLTSNEVAAVAAMVKGRNEGMVAFATRLQEKQRFIDWGPNGDSATKDPVKVIATER
jgi:hypothetical protein